MTDNRLKQILLSVAALAAPFFAGAVTAWPGAIQITNPDGSKIMVRAHGDEHFHYFTDAEESFIMERDSKGFFRKAVRDGKALEYCAESVNILMAEKGSQKCVDHTTPSCLPAIDDDGRTTYPTIGTDIHGLIVLLEYADTPFVIPNPKSTIERMLNEPGYSLYGGHGSAADYFTACSDGNFIPVFDVSEIITLPEPRAWYTGDNLKQFDNWGYALKYALEELDRQGMDFSRYDYDNDGVIDTVYFIYAGHGQHDTADGSCIWPHQGNYDDEIYGEVVLDGKIFRPYACSNELVADFRIPEGESAPCLAGVGVFCHEYSHVLGIPDLYNTGYNMGNISTPGTWSIMDQGPYNNDATQPPLYSAYEKWICRWTEFYEAEDGETYILDAATNNGHAVKIATDSPNEYFIVESRCNESWDESLGEEGLVIWHIDFDKNAWDNNLVNSRTNPGVSIHYSDKYKNTVTWPGVSNQIYLYPEYSNTLKTFRQYLDFSPYLTRLGYNEETGESSFEYNVVSERPDVETFIYSPWRPNDDSRGFTIFWEPLECADGYIVNVWRDTKKGPVYLAQDKIVIDTTELAFENLTAAWWQGDVRATVTVISGLPALHPSEEIVFTPMNLSTTGVRKIYQEDKYRDEVDHDRSIPSESHVFTLSGIEVTTHQLTPGLYIKKSNGKVSKVLVK